MQRLIATKAALVLIAGFLVLFVGGGSRFAIGLTLKPIVDQFGWARSELGLAVALFQIISALAMYAAGYLADRTSPRLVLSGGVLLSGIGIGLMSYITAPWHALVLYGVIFAIGNGAASTTPVGVMVTRAFPGRIGFANAAAMSGMSAGLLVMIAALAVVLATASWQAVYLWLGAAYLVLLPLLIATIPKTTPTEAGSVRATDGVNVVTAARTRQFWLLIAIYAICGFNDVFVATHVVAFAEDRGVNALLAGNLLALMGLTGLIGVVAGGVFSDRAGPMWPTAVSFAARVAVFALIMIDRSMLSVAIFALVFGATMLVTAPLTVVFVSESFGTRHLGGLTGLITMVHQMFGGVGAYLGAAIFDASGGYGVAFAIMFASSVIALILSLMLKQPKRAAQPA